MELIKITSIVSLCLLTGCNALDVKELSDISLTSAARNLGLTGSSSKDVKEPLSLSEVIGDAVSIIDTEKGFSEAVKLAVISDPLFFLVGKNTTFV